MAKKNGNMLRRLFARQGMILVLSAAILLEAISLLQYSFSKRALRAEAEACARNEVALTRLQIENMVNLVESDCRSLAWALSYCLEDPSSYDGLLEATMRKDTLLLGVFVAYEPYSIPGMGEWLEAYVTRSEDDSLETGQQTGPESDYSGQDWYRMPLQSGKALWSEPYFDEGQVVTYSVPVQSADGAVKAVLGVDVRLDWLDRVVNRLVPFDNAFSTLKSRLGAFLVKAPDTLAVEKHLSYESTIDQTGWQVSVVIPEEDIYDDIRDVNQLVLLLQVLGLLLMAAIVFRMVREQSRLEQMQAGQERMQEELRIAQGIQMSMVPKDFPPFPERNDIDIAACIFPAKEVGGDLYDFFIRDERLFFCVGDVSGKGVPASLLMAVSRSLFRTVSSHETSPGSIVANMNESLSEMNERNMFITFFCGVLDLGTGVLRYCNAGHTRPVLLHDSKRLLDVVPNIPLGVEADYSFIEQEVQLEYDDAIFVYTDGVTEAENLSYACFGEQRMLEALSGLRGAQEHLDEMKRAVDAFVGDAPQSDDLTMLFIHYLNQTRFDWADRHLVLHNDIQQIPRLADFVSAIAEDKGLDHSLTLGLHLALEEAVTNVIMYAYPEGTDAMVDIEALLGEDSLTFIVRDCGKPFDPTAAPEADVSLGVEDRAIGGLGIYLVRHIMDSVRYERTRTQNVLTMTKKL